MSAPRVARAGVGFPVGIPISLLRAGVRRDAAVCQTPMYDPDLALIDLSNDLSKDQSRSVEGETMAQSTVNNGVNVDALLAAREALRAAPEAAKFKWRAACKWKNGTNSETKVQGFHGLGAEQSHKTEFSFEADHPEIFASEDLGITPVEYVLVGLASCLTAGVAAVAQNRGIQLRSVEAKLEGSMDIQGILGIDSDVRNGYDDIKVTFNIDADASKKEIEALVAQSQKRSAVYDLVTNPTNVTVEIV